MPSGSLCAVNYVRNLAILAGDPENDVWRPFANMEKHEAVQLNKKESDVESQPTWNDEDETCSGMQQYSQTP